MASFPFHDYCLKLVSCSWFADVIAPMQSAIATPYLGTPILTVFLRLLGMELGKRVIFIGTVPAEAPLFTLGDDVVVSRTMHSLKLLYEKTGAEVWLFATQWK
jgi:hypothetical protein